MEIETAPCCPLVEYISGAGSSSQPPYATSHLMFYKQEQPDGKGTPKERKKTFFNCASPESKAKKCQYRLMCVCVYCKTKEC